MISITKTRSFKQSIICSVLLIVYFICEGQFLAYWWFIYYPVGLILIIVFLATVIKSVVFGIANRKKYAHPYLPFCINLLAILIAYSLPSANKSKQYYKGSGKLCNYKTGSCACTLYAEHYCVSGYNYMSTDINAEYLTDSLNFRLYLGVYDEEDGHINITCKGDSITVIKTNDEYINPTWSKPKTVERKVYSFADLKRRHVYD